MEDGIEWTFSRSSYYSKLGGVADTLEDRIRIQKVHLHKMFTVQLPNCTVNTLTSVCVPLLGCTKLIILQQSRTCPMEAYCGYPNIEALLHLSQPLYRAWSLVRVVLSWQAELQLFMSSGVYLCTIACVNASRMTSISTFLTQQKCM